MIITQYNKVFYEAFPRNVWPRARLFLKADFKRVDLDSTADRLYENGEFLIWLIDN
jgi:hypothetical protein